MNSISTWQLYCLMLLFQLGTSVVFGFSSYAKQDAWITVVLSTIVGLGIFWVYTKLLSVGSSHNWTSLLQQAFGKWIGYLLGIIYIFVFTYSAARDLRDLAELIRTFLLPNTPMVVIMILFQLIVSYLCYSGLERMGRIAEMNVPIVFLFFAFQVILLSVSGELQFKLLQPVAEKWKPILTSIFPGNISVPYAEAFAFAAFWSSIKQPGRFFKAALWSSISASLIILALDIMAICTVGPEVFSRSIFPVMILFHVVNVGDFLQNIDPLIVTNFMIGVLLKISIFTYASLSVIGDLWKVEGHKVAVMPISILILLFGFYMANNLSSHLFIGSQWVTWVLFIPMFLGLPFLALFSLWIRGLLKKEVNGQ